MFAATGPYAEWDYIGKTSASIPCQRKVKDHVESEVNHFHRGKSHTSPSKEGDIACLQGSYQQSQIHIKNAGRTLDAKDKAPDLVAVGLEGKKLMTTMKNWATNQVSQWSSEEDWTDY
jgi:hypothetical protein